MKRRFAVWGMTFVAFAAAALDIGEVAPSLESGFRIQGEPIARGEAKRLKLLTVCYFWTPGCAPCRKSVPVLNRIAADHRDRLTMIGIGCDEPAPVAASPIARELRFPVIADPDRKLLNAFLRRIDRVPMAVLLDVEGRFLWRGLPSELDAVVQSVLNGKFDLEAAKRIDRLGRDFRNAVKRGDFAAAERLLDGELQFRPNHPGVIVQKARLQAGERKNPRAAIATLTAAIGRAPRVFGFHEERAALLRRSGDIPALERAFAEIAARFADDPKLLLNLLQMEMRRPASEFEFGPVRELLRALESRPGLDPSLRVAADELGARYAFMCGRLTEAVRLEERALGGGNLPAEQKKRLESDLAYYRRARTEQLKNIPLP